VLVEESTTALALPPDVLMLAMELVMVKVSVFS